MTTKHATCTHPATKAGRASCRKGSVPTEGMNRGEAIASGRDSIFTPPSQGRTDVHRPTVFVPEDYEYSHAGTYNSDEMYAHIRKDAARMLRLRLSEGYSFARHQHAGQCGHCGSRITHYAVMMHIPSHELIEIGETCLDGRFDMATHEFQSWRKMRAGNNAKKAKAAKLAAFLTNVPDAQQILDYDGDNSFINDLADKLRQFAELSEKQITAGVAAIARDIDRAAERAAKAEKLADAPEITEGRQTIVATFISRKFVESDFGYNRGSYKMLIEDANGNRYYGTEPAAFQGDKGDAITITATVTRSNDDSHFGFFKRPTLQG